MAKLIILGHKTIEVRSQRTNIRERVHIYAGQNRIEADEEARIAAKKTDFSSARPLKAGQFRPRGVYKKIFSRLNRP